MQLTLITNLSGIMPIACATVGPLSIVKRQMQWKNINASLFIINIIIINQCHPLVLLFLLFCLLTIMSSSLCYDLSDM